jgi:hypothetical protein
MTWVQWTGSLLCVVIGGFVGLSALGRRRWARALQALQTDLDKGRTAGVHAGPWPAGRYDPGELEGLPAPVQRFFRAVLQAGQPHVAAVTLGMSGTFNLSPTGEQWRPFSSRQRVTTCRPGFVWDANILMLPGVGVRVVDSYVAGQGLLHAAIGGLITMARFRGDGEIARGEFMRWFAEVAWYPTALLPSQGVQWEAVDGSSANATISDGELTLTLLFRFNESGPIESFRAEARGAMVGKQMVMAPWEGRWSNYQKHEGMLVPMTGEVAWMRPEGRRPYFLGTVTSLVYEWTA